MRRRRRGVFWALLFVAILVNLPIGHHFWQEYQLSRSGIDVTAEVTGTDVLSPDHDPHYLVRFRFDEDIDPDATVWPVEVDRAAFDRAKADQRIEVRVRPGHPSTFSVEGEVTSPVGWIILLIVDVLLILLVVLLHRAGRLRSWDDERDADGPDGPGTSGPPDPSGPF